MYLYMFDRVSFRCDSSVDKTGPEHLGETGSERPRRSFTVFPAWCSGVRAPLNRRMHITYHCPGSAGPLKDLLLTT